MLHLRDVSVDMPINIVYRWNGWTSEKHKGVEQATVDFVIQLTVWDFQPECFYLTKKRKN